MSNALHPVRNPRNGLIDYHFEITSAEQLQSLCGGLRAAQPVWAARGPGERAEIMERWAQALRAEREAIIAALHADTGRWAETELEFDSILQMLQRWGKAAPEWLQPAPPRASGLPQIAVGLRQAPVPLVGVISPWNFPLLLSLIDAIPALMCGCAVAIKPSEITPRFVATLQRSLAQVPELASVLCWVLGPGETGAQLVEQVDQIVFTGSVATGRKVGEQAARRFIPAFLELGGKDPAIVLADADIERASAALAWGGMVNAGQSCLSIERIYVEAPIFETFARRLAQRVGELGLCYPQRSSGRIGPLIAARQAELIQAQLDDAFAKGARALCGGCIVEHGGGLWCEPTVLIDVDHGMKIMTEETFGPILPVMSVPNAEAALRLANDSAYGLSGAVFGDNHARALALAQQLQVGAISVNDCALTAIVHEGEKQSFKLSGLGGSRMGVNSLQRFVRRQALLQNAELQWDPWWFHQA